MPDWLVWTPTLIGIALVNFWYIGIFEGARWSTLVACPVWVGVCGSIAGLVVKNADAGVIVAAIVLATTVAAFLADWRWPAFFPSARAQFREWSDPHPEPVDIRFYRADGRVAPRPAQLGQRVDRTI